MASPASSGRSAAAAGRPRRRKGMPLWQELPLLLVVAFCLAVLIRTFLMQAFYIPSGSMEDTLLVGDRVLVNKVVYDVPRPGPRRGHRVQGHRQVGARRTRRPERRLLLQARPDLGDLVGISRPGEKDFIKRVIGVPGDQVSCCDVEGRIYVNGVPHRRAVRRPQTPRSRPPNPTSAADPRSSTEVTVQPGRCS